MLDIAAKGGITEIVATPHYREDWKDWHKVRQVYADLTPYAQARGIDLKLGAEFYCAEFDRDHAPKYKREFSFGDDHKILFELDKYSLLSRMEERIWILQQAGLTVLIPHPERNRELQKDKRVAQRYLEMCCSFVLSTSSLTLWPLSEIGRAARRGCRQGRYEYVASDAHSPEDMARHIKILSSPRFAGLYKGPPA